MAAILNLLDLWSIMGCPGGTRSVFTRLFGQNESFNDNVYRQKGYADLFFPLQSFSRKTLRKIGQKSAHKY